MDVAVLERASSFECSCTSYGDSVRDYVSKTNDLAEWMNAVRKSPEVISLRLDYANHKAVAIRRRRDGALRRRFEAAGALRDHRLYWFQAPPILISS